MFLYLESLVARINGRAENEYNRVVAKNGNATLATGKTPSEIEKKNESGDGVAVQQPDLSKPRLARALKFNNEKSQTQMIEKSSTI